ncbi:unnamed protein product [Symbiodinium sp. CCMP2456]|nr:unnamed protein product [Symbiodinium sp. CCMP2456]
MTKIEESQGAERKFGSLQFADHLMGSNLLLQRPCFLRFLVALFCLGQIGATVALKVVSNGQPQGHGFTLVSSVLYALAAAGLSNLLGQANSSADLELAISRLHSFVADFMLCWNDVSGKEWRLFLGGWLFLVAVFSATQVFESWHLGADLVGQDSLQKELSYVVAALSALSLCISSGVVTLTAYMQSHVLLGLHKSLDCWCCDIANDPDFEAGVQNWNAMQDGVLAARKTVLMGKT